MATRKFRKELYDFQKALRGTVYVIDTETTGTDPSKDAVVQISVRKLVNGKEVKNGAKTFWIENTSGREIPAEINGNPNPVLAEYNKRKGKKDGIRTKEEVYGELSKLLNGQTVVGHNIENFDKAILQNNSPVALDFKTLDTLSLGRKVLQFNSYKLEEYAKLRGIKTTSHLAEADTATTIKLIQELREAIPSQIREAEQRRAFAPSKKNPYLLNGVPLNILNKAWRNLLGHDYDRYAGNHVPQDPNKYLRHAYDELPSGSQWGEGWISPAHGTLLQTVKENGENVIKEVEDIRNFRITPAGITSIAHNLVPTLGACAYAAVSDSIGPAAMRASKITGSLTHLLSMIPVGIQRTLEVKLKNQAKKRLNAKDYEQFLLILKMKGGNQAVINKTAFATDTEPLVEDKKHGLAFRPSTTQLMPAGVSGSALSTQAAGDGTMAALFFLMQKDMGNGKINWLSVYDGMYFQAQFAELISKYVNEAAFRAQGQNQFAAVDALLNSLGKYLMGSKKEPGWVRKATNPQEAVIEFLQALAENKAPDGTELNFTDKELTSFGKTLFAFDELLTDPPPFDPKLDLDKSNFRPPRKKLTT